MNENLKSIFKFFEKISELYRENELSRINFERMSQNNYYALKMFLHFWVYERDGAPMGYKLAAVKSINYIENNGRNGDLRDIYQIFYPKNFNQNRNPGMDNNLLGLNFNSILTYINQGDLSSAFQSLSNINGLGGHKLRAFFIRDTISMLNSEDRLNNDTNLYLFTLPIDMWVRRTIKKLSELNYVRIDDISGQRGIYNLTRKDRITALKLIRYSNIAKVSPIKVNQGIWYFSSQIVGSEKRLYNLLNEAAQIGSEILNQEFELIKDCLIKKSFM